MKGKTLVIIWVLLIGLISTVTAIVVTINNPASGTSVGGTYNFNVTLDSVDLDAENATCAFFIRATDTVNATYVLLANVSNSSGRANDSGVNLTFKLDNPAMQDSSIAQMYVECLINGTGNFTTSSVTTFVVDNSVPVCDLVGGVIANTINDTTDKTKAYTLTYSCGNSTSAVLFIGDEYTMTESSDVCTYDIVNVPEGTYDVKAQCSDGLNKTLSSTVLSFTIETKGGTGKTAMYNAAQLLKEERAKTLAIGTATAEETQAKAKAWVKKETTKEELTKTGVCTGIGAAAGFLGGPLAPITVPFGAGIGFVIGILI